MSKRAGVSLTEILIAIAIITIFVGLSMVAIQQIRETSVRTQSMNNLRQIVIAVHDYATLNNNLLPCYPSVDSIGPQPTVFETLLPFCELNVNLLISPADPTQPTDEYELLSSYAANGQLFVGVPNILTTIRDGQSNTVAFAEHYSICGSVVFSTSSNGEFGMRRATFADRCDIYPVTSGNPPVSQSSANVPADANLTFQVAPSRSVCRPEYAQTPHRSGMLIALADGTVRILAPNIAPPTYWALITPAGGEGLGEL